MDYTYSVAIPHYNSPKLLARMLNSIPEREDIQVIVVDDGSCEENVIELKKLQHKNLELILLGENHGGGHARNVGLNKATGKWFISVDADDYFSEDAFEVFDRYKDAEIDYLCFCIVVVDEKTLASTGHFVRSDISVRKYLKEKSKESLAYFKFRNYESWNKLLSMNFIRENNIHWEDCRINIDVMFSMQVGLRGRNYLVIPDELYNLVFTSDSITRKKKSIEREFGFYLQVMKRNYIYKKLKLKYPFYRSEILYLPFLIKKRGIMDTYRFIKFRFQHIDEVRKAKTAYKVLLEGVDIASIMNQIH